MRNNPKNLTVFDIGSSKIAGLFAKRDELSLEIVSAYLNSSSGFENGKIVNLLEAEKNIVHAIYFLEKEAKETVKDVIVSLSAQFIKSYYSFHEENLSSDKTISQEMLNNFYLKALQKFNILGKEIIHYFPIEFVLDDSYVVENPLGLYADKILCRLHIIAAESLFLKNIVACFARCNIEVRGFVVASYAVGRTLLKDKDTNLGSLIVDMGSGHTGFTIFLKNFPIYIDHVKLGSSFITENISKKFGINFYNAEKLKILYGSADTSSSEGGVINLNQQQKEEEGVFVDSKILSEEVNKNILDIFFNIYRKYEQSQLDSIVRNKVFLIGGGAYLKGIKQIVARTFQKNVEFVLHHEGVIYENKHYSTLKNKDFDPAFFINTVSVLNYYHEFLCKNYYKGFTNSFGIISKFISLFKK